MDEALCVARRLLERSGGALEVIKSAVLQLGDMTQESAFHAEALNGQQAFASEDAREGLSAFAERRPPAFPSRRRRADLDVGSPTAGGYPPPRTLRLGR